MNEIYPIDLEDWRVEKLVERYCAVEFRNATRFMDRSTTYCFYGELLENGDVKISIRYDSDNGFIMSCGQLMSTVIRPYSEAQLDDFKEAKIYQLVSKELGRQEQAKYIKKLEKLRNKMFPRKDSNEN